VESPIEVLRSATLINARILRREGKPGEKVPDALGELVPDACADLIVVDGDPILDLGRLRDQGAHLPFLMKGGRIYKNDLTN
jgi:imidazolonepropionase-like amidohydrolase